MEEKYVPSISNLIALINILDEYEKFGVNLERFVLKAGNNNQKKIRIIDALSKGARFFGKEKEKKFYNENKQVIDKICEFSSLSLFTYENYNGYGQKRGISFYLDYFYQYFKINRDKLPQILNLLEKLKELGFNKIYFDENFDFTKEKYEIRNDNGVSQSISYIDNFGL